MPQKRTQPVAVAAPAPTRPTKSSKVSRASNSPSTLAVPSSNSPETPALTPSSSTTPPSSFPGSLARSSKKLNKAVRSGNGHGHGSTGGKGTMKTRRTAVGGPEAELSEDDDDEEDDVSVVEDAVVAGERVIEGVEGKSAPKSELSMHTLLDGAKLRPEPHNISRGYELLTSPASRLVIPFDSINSKGKLQKATGQHVAFGSAPSSPGFSDDVEWEWEDLCFEMDGVDITNAPSAAKKDAYAEVVKRAA